MDDFDLDLSMGNIFKRVFYSLNRTLNITLYDNVEFLDLAFLNLCVDFIKRKFSRFGNL